MRCLAEVMILPNITRHQTREYNRPQANGLVGRFHRNFKGALNAPLADNDWGNKHPIVIWGI